MNQSNKVWVLSTLVVAGAFLSAGSAAAEPSYHGRSLTSWLKQCYDASMEETQKISQAHLAINTIGAKKALPRLLEMIQASDGALRSWIIQKNEKWDIRVLRLHEAADTRQLGLEGFEALGTNAAPAVPELTGMLDDTNRALIALQCLIFIGMPAERSVCRALTNRIPAVRAFAASQVAWVTDDIEVYLKRLEGPLNDSDVTVRFAAVQALGLQTKYPDEVLPLLVKAMCDPAQSISGYAAKFLGELGTNGIKAFGALSNVVATGNAYMAAQALRSLLSIAPDQALPILLETLQSTNQDRRSRAASVLGEFAVPTPQILDSLKRAAKDSDAKVARNATDSLRRYRQKEKDLGTYRVVIGGEPSYGGKLLGDWLKRKPDDYEPSEQAKRAVRAVGTNAIPVLLARLAYVDPKYGLYDYDTGLEAVGGFYLLGEQALPALPILEEMINGDNSRIAVFALISSCSLGSNAVPVVTRGLTNDFADVRSEALHCLREGPLAAFPEARKSAVPWITEMLRDPDDSVRMNAIAALKEIDPKAAAKAGVK